MSYSFFPPRLGEGSGGQFVPQLSEVGVVARQVFGRFVATLGSVHALAHVDEDSAVLRGGFSVGGNHRSVPGDGRGNRLG